MSRGYFIYYFSSRSAENLDTLYLIVVGIPSFSNITITKKINLGKYDENDSAYQEMWEVDSDGGVGDFLNSIAYEK